MTWETETFTVPELEKILAGKKKKYIRYEEGITLYSMGKIPLRELAQEAHALIYLKRVAVINTEILDEYIERYPLSDETLEGRVAGLAGKAPAGRACHGWQVSQLRSALPPAQRYTCCPGSSF